MLNQQGREDRMSFIDVNFNRTTLKTFEQVALLSTAPVSYVAAGVSITCPSRNTCFDIADSKPYMTQCRNISKPNSMFNV